MFARQRHRQHRFASARTPLYQQARLQAQHAQHRHLLLGGLVQGVCRVIHMGGERHQLLAVGRQQLLERMLLRPRPWLRIRRCFAKDAQQGRRRVGQRRAVQQKSA